MDVYEIRNQSDLLMAVSAALENRDAVALEGMMDLVVGWLQTPEERDAQVALLESALEAVHSLWELER